MTRICNKIGALPVALYGRWHASPENRWTQIGRAKGRGKKIEARKDKRMFEKKRKETRKESKKERCTSSREEGKESGGRKKGRKKKKKGEKNDGRKSRSGSGRVLLTDYGGWRGCPYPR